MSTRILSKTEYLKMFYEPAITPYDFLRLLFAQLNSEGVRRIPRDLTEKLYTLKKTGKYNELMTEISFKDKGFFVFSNEIEDSISELQTMRLIGKPNPSYNSLYIYYSEELSESIRNEYEPATVLMMRNLAIDLLQMLRTDKHGEETCL